MEKCDFINIDPEVMHGTPVFKGSRVPVEALFDYLETGESIDSFIDDFPSVERAYAEMALEFSKLAMVG